MSTFRFAVFISGNGSNLQAIIDAISTKTLKAELCVVISDRPDAFGLQRAEAAGIATRVFERKTYPSKQAHEQAILAFLESFSVELVVLAGYMRLLSADFIAMLAGKIINIHPALLPRYKGLDTYKRVLTSDDAEHGSSVHIVTADVDDGAVIAQSKCAVLSNDTEDTLKKRVQTLEHRLYPTVLQWLAEGTLTIQEGVPYHNQQPLLSPIILTSSTLSDNF